MNKYDKILKKYHDTILESRETKPEESTELDEAAAIVLDDIIGDANQLIVKINNLMNKVDKAKKSQLDKAKKSISVLGDVLKGIKTIHFKEGVGFGGANFTTPDQEMNNVIVELERLINNFKQRGGDFKTYVPDLQKAYKILYKTAIGR